MVVDLSQALSPCLSTTERALLSGQQSLSLTHTLIADVPLSAFSVWTLIDQPGALIAIGDRKVF